MPDDLSARHAVNGRVLRWNRWDAVWMLAGDRQCPGVKFCPWCGAALPWRHEEGAGADVRIGTVWGGRRLHYLVRTSWNRWDWRTMCGSPAVDLPTDGQLAEMAMCKLCLRYGKIRMRKEA